MKLLRSIRLFFFCLIVTFLFGGPKATPLSSLEVAEQVSALVAVPAIWAERHYECKPGAEPGKMAKFTKVVADITRLASGALLLKNQYDTSKKFDLRLQKYTLLWLFIDFIKLGADILPESVFEQVTESLAKKLEGAELNRFEKLAQYLRTKILPGAEMVAMLSSSFVTSPKAKFYVSGVKGICRAYDEYLGAKNKIAKRLFLALFVAQILMLGYDGFCPPVLPAPAGGDGPQINLDPNSLEMRERFRRQQEAAQWFDPEEDDPSLHLDRVSEYRGEPAQSALPVDLTLDPVTPVISMLREVPGTPIAPRRWVDGVVRRLWT